MALAPRKPKSALVPSVSQRTHSRSALLSLAQIRRRPLRLASVAVAQEVETSPTFRLTVVELFALKRNP